jgi:glycosyltransferase involved in cell wall biosynthesis
MIDRGEGHEFILAMNGSHADGAWELLNELVSGRIPSENVHLWPSLAVSRHWRHRQTTNDGLRFLDWFTRETKTFRQRCITGLKPDIVHVMSQFETIDATPAANDDPFPFVITHYDLIPFAYPESYLPDELTRRWFYKRLNVLKRAEFLLTISEYSRREIIKYLDLEPERVINVSAAADPQFVPLFLSDAQRIDLLARHGIFGEFVMYTGGFDSRKNLPALVRAYAKLSANIRNDLKLVCVGFIDSHQTEFLQALARKSGLRVDELRFIGYVSDNDLVGLYNTCKLLVLPSLSEGFGLPVLEAMACGAPVIASNTTSLPEVVGNKNALFNPLDEASITRKLTQTLTDDAFRARLTRQGLEHCKRFSWSESARRALEAFEFWYDYRTATN